LRQRVMAPVSWLDAQSGGGSPTDGEIAGGYALSPEGSARAAKRAAAVVDRFQTENEHEPGMPLAALAVELGLNVDLARAVVARTELIHQGALVAALKPKAVDEDPRWGKAREVLEATGLAPPALDALGLEGELLRSLIRERRLVRVSDDFALLPGQVSQFLGLINGIEGPFSVSDFRQAAGITRKHAVPLLEWADREGHTIREGDFRRTR
jgi:selenocysteine-specific elongation factor